MSKEISIECAKDYADDTKDDALISHLNAFIDELRIAQQTYSQSLLLDDSSYSDPSYDLTKAVTWLRNVGLQPDVILKESDIKDSCDEVLAMINYDLLSTELADILQSENKYTCASLFLASWSLIRLGYLGTPNYDKEYVAHRIVNILPSSFQADDGGAVDIIKATPFSDAASKIENRFI